MSKPFILELKKFLEDIIEEGTNSKGSYAKLKNGTLIQWGIYSESNVEFKVSSGPFYRCSLRQFDDFPVEFVEQNNDISVFVEIQNISTPEMAFLGKYGGINNNSAPSLTNPGKFTIMKEFNSNADIRVSYLAIGKWK